jgi:hypothetical protein
MQDASTLATAHYPETLDRIFVIGAPSFFPTVWSWIKKWFDPITTSKIFILSHHDVKKTLELFIDPANIPKNYGGKLDFKFGDRPVMDPAYKDVVTFENGVQDFPPGPVYWIHGKDEKAMEGLAVGSVANKPRSDKFCVVKKLLRDDEDVPESKVMNGHAKSNQETLGEEFLNTPTAAPSVTNTEPEANANVVVNAPAESQPASEPAKAEEPVVVQEGELVPASRPEPVHFVTANDDLNTLSLNEKVDSIPNGMAHVDDSEPPTETIHSNGEAHEEAHT